MERTITGEMANDLAIDQNHLEDESSYQMSLYANYAPSYVRARSERDRLRNLLDFTKAEVALDIRRNPPMDIKITEPTIEALVESNAAVQRVKEELRLASETLFTQESLMTGIDQRNSQLGNLVSLYTRGYYTGKSKGADFRDEMRQGLNGGER
jgi:uncharacterized protein (DUF2342 family)